MTNEELLPFCDCGCGLRVTKPGNRFRHGHNKSNLGNFKPKPEPKLCGCGCGLYALPGNDYIAGHQNRGRQHSQEIKDRQSEIIKQFNKDHPEAGKIHSEFMKEYYNDPKNIEANRLRSIKQFSDQSARDEMSKIKKQFYIDNPEARSILSEILRNSDIHKAASEKKRGGYDIVKHHYIYDHNDLSKYTIKMTRSEHATLHHNLRALGIKIPHINTGHETADELKLMEYIKKIESEV